jgi:hypothetical protein
MEIILRPREHLDRTVATTADDPPPVGTPDDTAHAFPAHDAVALDLLRAAPLLEVPEAEACVVASGDELTAIG